MSMSTDTAGPTRAGRSRHLGVVVLAACLVGPALAAQPIPLRAGTYCGPDNARIVVDVDHDQVAIDDTVCSFPVIAADHLQSDLCSKPDGTSGRQNFDFSVVGPDFAHGGVWYRFCGPVPADPTAPAPPAASGG